MALPVIRKLIVSVTSGSSTTTGKCMSLEGWMLNLFNSWQIAQEFPELLFRNSIKVPNTQHATIEVGQRGQQNFEAHVNSHARHEQVNESA